LTIPARGSSAVHADAMFSGFLDLTYAYRFGPPGHDVICATLRNSATGTSLGAAHGFPCGLPVARDNALRLSVRAEPLATGYALSVETDRFAHAVAIDADGFVPDDNFFHLEPGEARRLTLHAERPGARLHGTVSALNGAGTVTLAPLALAEASNG